MSINAISWFEIPVSNLDRAQKFYEAVLGEPLRREQMGPSTLAVFSYDQGSGIGGCLFAGEAAPKPSKDGTLVYLDARPTLDTVLARVEAAGGRITTPPVKLPGDMGSFAHITDTEGNRVGLHALK